MTIALLPVALVMLTLVACRTSQVVMKKLLAKDETRAPIYTLDYTLTGLLHGARGPIFIALAFSGAVSARPSGVGEWLVEKHGAKSRRSWLGRFAYPAALCDLLKVPITPRRSLFAASVGTAAERGGTTTATSGWRSATTP